MIDPAKKPGQQPESYDPKDAPEMMRALEEEQAASLANPPAVKAATATIKAKARDVVRIIELPASEMIWSGICPSSESKDDETIRRFNEWFPAQDELRKDRFYARDFLWHDTQANGFAWGLAVTEVPENTGGWEVMDFPGGLFAVVNYNCVEGERGAVDAYYGIKKWVEKSGCFAMDEGAGRYVMWHCFNPEAAWKAMGYGQCDQYVPIRIKEEAK